MKVLAIAIVAVVAFATSAVAQSSRRNFEREKRIERELQSIAPTAVPVFQKATRAMDAEDYVAAVPLFREALVQAPGFSPVLRRLGGTLVAIGASEEGLELLRKAIAQERSPENLISLASALAYPQKGKQGSEAARQYALDLAKEASQRYRNTDDPSYLATVAQLALSLGREQDFRQAATELAKTYRAEAVTHYFAAIAAAMDGDWIRAEREARTAGRLGMPPDVVEELLASGIRTRAIVTRVEYGAEYLLLAWAAGLLLLYLAGSTLSRATVTSIERADPTELTSRSALFLRRIYRALVGVAAVYYYVSLPFVAVLVLGGAAALIYGFILLGQIPIKLVLFIAIAAIVTIYKMVQSLLIRIPPGDEGRELAEAEAPGLFELARDVANKVGTRPIDEVRVTPGTQLAVCERGSMRDRASDEGQRVLVLGVGVLNGFRRAAFRAVLAHEYGHFSHRDTAGGDLALRVRQDVMKFAVAMAQQGQAVWWNLAFQFLRVYDFLFRRISHGATRLQEVLADRVAAQTYGAKAFGEGLRHVIRRSVEFKLTATRELQAAMQMRRTCRNLYHLAAMPEDRVDEQVQQMLARPTSEDDTHPSPEYRIALVSGVTSQPDATDSGMVWDLFANAEELKAEMSAAIESHAKEVAFSHA